MKFFKHCIFCLLALSLSSISQAEYTFYESKMVRLMNGTSNTPTLIIPAECRGCEDKLYKVSKYLKYIFFGKEYVDIKSESIVSGKLYNASIAIDRRDNEITYIRINF